MIYHAAIGSVEDIVTAIRSPIPVNPIELEDGIRSTIAQQGAREEEQIC